MKFNNGSVELKEIWDTMFLQIYGTSASLNGRNEACYYRNCPFMDVIHQINNTQYVIRACLLGWCTLIKHCIVLTADKNI